LFLSSNFILSQYTQNDSALVRTTFLREFNKKIINNYLFSEDTTQVNAALLSVSHSEDNTFIDELLKLDFNKYGKNISFALGQLGESQKSADYLISILQGSSNNYNIETFDAIGKCGDSLSLDLLFKLIDEKSINSPFGFQTAIVNFKQRGIQNDKSIEYLSKLLNSDISEIQLFQTLFAIYRIGPSQDFIPLLHNILIENHDEKNKLYALSNFRKLEFFPNDFELLIKLANSNSWRIRTETAKSACYFPYKNIDEIQNYLSLLHDKNLNVSRSAATSLKNIKYSGNSDWLQNKVEKQLVDEALELTPNTRGELLISFVSLFNIDFEEIIKEHSDLIQSKFIYRLPGSNSSELEFKFKYLNKRIGKSNEVELLDILPTYLSLQNKYSSNEKYVENLFEILKSNKTSSVSIIADGLELPTIQMHKEELQKLILEQIFNQKDNPQFAETIISLVNLSNKIDEDFYNTVLITLSNSSLNSIKKYAFEKQGLEFKALKDESQFQILWSAAFKFKFAEVETNKGNFTIELKPDIAPITCGNFISLSENGFYNGVIFHRVVPNFVIQTGDITNTGWGGPGYEIVSEFSSLPFERSSVGIASIGKDTEGSQWFVMHSIFPHLNGRYTNWANIIKGMDIVDIID
jgi:cyclophilin family peptidyl-prolyl cis-trans isomerase